MSDLMTERAIELAATICINAGLPIEKAVDEARKILEGSKPGPGVDGRGRPFVRAEVEDVNWDEVKENAEAVASMR